MKILFFNFNDKLPEALELHRFFTAQANAKTQIIQNESAW
jgi:hypothetical protein